MTIIAFPQTEEQQLESQNWARVERAIGLSNVLGSWGCSATQAVALEYGAWRMVVMLAWAVGHPGQKIPTGIEPPDQLTRMAAINLLRERQKTDAMVGMASEAWGQK